MYKILNKDISAVILAAGFGLRLKNNKPKALVPLEDGKTILDYQLEKLTQYIPIDRIAVVVGYKKELLMEQHPDLTFIYNERYSETNTAKSLLKALKKVKRGDVLWLNGDVVFNEEVLPKLINESIAKEKSCILVDHKRCGDEEIKYDTDNNGNIRRISKKVRNPKGEALGINLLIEKDLPFFIKHLKSVGDQDYFEKGIESLIGAKQAEFVPVQTKGLFCQEIDFPGDLKAVQKYLLTVKEKVPSPI